jgi:putative ABC transport system permease protein
MILVESVVLAVAGGAIGLGIAAGLCGLVRKAPGFIGQLKTLSIHPPVALACLGVAVVIGLISSAVPAWNASNTPIVEALRRND